MSDSFQLLLRVRYAECDAQGIVFNARYGDYADVAATEFLRALFGSYQAILDRGLDQHVVRLATNWHAPAGFDDILRIDVTTARIGNSSYTLAMRFVNHQTDALVATTEVTYVMVGAHDHKKTKVPDDMRTALEAGAVGVVVDQVGAL